MKKRLEALMAEYGPIALAVYLALFALAMVGFSTAIVFGLQVDSTAAGAGTLAAAWLATKVTQPARIAATVVLTPLVARVVRRLRRRPAGRTPTED
jgi:hypothetical protein